MNRLQCPQCGQTLRIENEYLAICDRCEEEYPTISQCPVCQHDVYKAFHVPYKYEVPIFGILFIWIDRLLDRVQVICPECYHRIRIKEITYKLISRPRIFHTMLM
ncbi:MAG: hypothetical protein GXO78_05865 [Calditrichaeota bacterium]|nr:hypothetical protein [Calditrichota bacterium]